VRFLLFFLFYLSLCLAASANDTVGHSRILVSYASQLYLNKFNIDNPSNSANPFHTKNTFGYFADLLYERVTRYGLIIDAGLRFGMRKHNITIRQDLSNFDSQATNNLKGKVYTTNIDPELYYLDPCVMLGYRKMLKNHYAISAKIGVYETKYINGYEDVENTSVGYYSDNHSTYNMANFLTYTALFGETINRKLYNNNYTSNSLRSYDYYNLFEFYIGIERQFPKGLVKNLSVGMEVNGGYPEFFSSVQIKSIPTISTVNENYFNYRDRSIAVGLVFSAALWK
jgi:hypothetical protein